MVITVKFLIVAASPIEATPQTFKKLQFFYKKVSYLENLQLKPHGDFWDLLRTKTIFISNKKDNDQVFIKTPAASYANRANRAHAI